MRRRRILPGEYGHDLGRGRRSGPPPAPLQRPRPYGWYSALFRTGHPLHLWLLAGTAVLLVGSVALAAAGVAITVCLRMLALAPVVTVVGYETLGHRHMAEASRRL